MSCCRRRPSRPGSSRPPARRAAAAWARWPAPGRSRGGAGRRRPGSWPPRRPRRGCRRTSSSSRATRSPSRSSARWRGQAEDGAGHARAVAGVGADHDVVQRGHVGEQADVLERAGDAEPGDLVGPAPGEVGAREPDLALGRLVHAGDDVEHRRLARSVGPDQGEDLALVDVRGRARRWRRRRRSAPSGASSSTRRFGCGLTAPVLGGVDQRCLGDRATPAHAAHAALPSAISRPPLAGTAAGPGPEDHHHHQQRRRRSGPEVGEVLGTGQDVVDLAHHELAEAGATEVLGQPGRP